jgi:hypothetical protein
MSDDITVSSPTVNAPEPQPSHAEAITAAFQNNLRAVASGTEDATDYVRERATQTKHENGQDISLPEQREWHDRHDAALKRARDAAAIARGETPPSQQQHAPEELPGYVSKDAPDYDEKYAIAKIRFDDYYNNPENIGGSLTAQDHKAQVLGWLTTYDPSDVLSGHFMASELGPQMAETIALEGGPDLIKQIVNMPPAERAKNMAKLEGYLYARNEQQRQGQAWQQAQHPAPRQYSAAPPIIKSPRGAANVPADVLSLAGKDDVTNYVRARRAQEKRANEDR